MYISLSTCTLIYLGLIHIPHVFMDTFLALSDNLQCKKKH